MHNLIPTFENDLKILKTSKTFKYSKEIREIKSAEQYGNLSYFILAYGLISDLVRSLGNGAIASALYFAIAPLYPSKTSLQLELRKSRQILLSGISQFHQLLWLLQYPYCRLLRCRSFHPLREAKNNPEFCASWKFMVFPHHIDTSKTNCNPILPPHHPKKTGFDYFGFINLFKSLSLHEILSKFIRITINFKFPLKWKTFL